MHPAHIEVIKNEMGKTSAVYDNLVLNHCVGTPSGFFLSAYLLDIGTQTYYFVKKFSVPEMEVKTVYVSQVKPEVWTTPYRLLHM